MDYAQFSFTMLKGGIDVLVVIINALPYNINFNY